MMAKKNKGSIMARKEKFWIQKAISKPGALRSSLKAKKGKNIAAGKLKKAEKAKGTLGKRARLAMTLKKLSKRKKR
jgi:hypothetical protein